MTLKYVVEDTDRHGNVRIYVRRNGKKIRITAQIGTPEFAVEYRRALAALEQHDDADRPAVAQQGTLRWLAERYYESANFRGLATRTRTVRRNMIDALCQMSGQTGPQHGDKPFARMEPRHVRAIRDERADRPEAANAIVKALRQVFAWAIEAGHAHSNPARDIPYIRTASEGFHTWTVQEVKQFEAVHPIGSRARLAMALMLFLGVRRSDVVRLGPQMIRDGMIYWVEAKGRTRLRKERSLPVLPELQHIIDVTPSGHLTFLATEFDKPYTPDGFGNWFRRRCREAGLDHCSPHGLRKAGATIAAENGATEHQLMAIFGWESTKQAGVYTRKANRQRLAASAMHLIVPDDQEQTGDTVTKKCPTGSRK